MESNGWVMFNGDMTNDPCRGPFLHHIPGVNFCTYFQVRLLQSNVDFVRSRWCVNLRALAAKFTTGTCEKTWGFCRAMADVSWCFMGNMMRIHIGELAVSKFSEKNIGLSSHPPKICWLVLSHARSFQQDVSKGCATLTYVNHQKWLFSLGEASWNWDIKPIFFNILNTPNQFLGLHFFDHMEALQSTLAFQASYAKRGKNNSSIDPLTTNLGI